MNEELLCQSLFYKESYFSFNQAFLFFTLVRRTRTKHSYTFLEGFRKIEKGETIDKKKFYLFLQV